MVTVKISKTAETFAKSNKKLNENVEKEKETVVPADSELGAEETPPHILKVLISSINIMQHRITTSRMAGDPPEVELAPKLHLDSFDFDKAAIGIEDGTYD
jgi:NTE family protein